MFLYYDIKKYIKDNKITFDSLSLLFSNKLLYINDYEVYNYTTIDETPVMGAMAWVNHHGKIGEFNMYCIFSFGSETYDRFWNYYPKSKTLDNCEGYFRKFAYFRQWNTSAQCYINHKDSKDFVYPQKDYDWLVYNANEIHKTYFGINTDLNYTGYFEKEKVNVNKGTSRV